MIESRSSAPAAPASSIAASAHSLRARLFPAVVLQAAIGAAAAAQPAIFATPPIVQTLATLLPVHGDATVSDLETADFDGDGRLDLVVAWHATAPTQMSANLRRVTLFRGAPSGLEPWNEFDLYRPDANIEVLSVFRNGAAEVTPGDFDGDGDADFAVTAFFGDEIWFFENKGAPEFEMRLKFAFGTNSPSNFLTPPESAAADFDGDGRDDLVYIADPIQHVQGRVVHFWRTSSGMANIYRANWEAGPGARFMQWTRGLAIDDFDADGRPDLCFTGTTVPPNEEGPVVAIWRAFNPQTRLFTPAYFDAPFLCADIATQFLPGDCGPSVLLTDQSGRFWSEWIPVSCPPDAPVYTAMVYQTDFGSASPNRGQSLALADLNGDGHNDVITKQKLGQIGDAKQIEISFASVDPVVWSLPSAVGIKTNPFSNTTNPVLRPHNLAVADIVGNRQPDVIAGFGRSPAAQPGGPDRLVVAIWKNGCDGDTNADGHTNDADLNALLESMGSCAGDSNFETSRDLDRDGCVAAPDYELAALHWGCRIWARVPGDVNCDGVVDFGDIASFVQLLLDLTTGKGDGAEPCAVDGADVNGDGVVNASDIGPFVLLITNQL